MRASFASLAALLLMLTACTESSQSEGASTIDLAVTSTVRVDTTTTTPAATSTTSPGSTTTTFVQETPAGVAEVDLGDDIVAWVYQDEPTIVAFRGSEMIFTLTHSCGDCFATKKEMTRDPNGVLTAEGWKGGVWTVGDYGQIEINRLWPPETPLNMDVLWLSDYTGVTEDTLTGFTPEPSDTFTLYDELVLEPRGDNKGAFGLHADCKVEDDQIAAALLSFEGPTPVALMAWTIDYDSMTFTPLEDLNTLSIGNCLTPKPRPAN